MEITLSQAAGYAAFGFVLLLTLGGALVAVLPKNIVQNVFGLALSLSGVAGLYVFLNSGFLAMMQVLIYVGAICVAIIFAIMLSEPMHLTVPPRAVPKVMLALVVSLAVIIIFGFLLGHTQFGPELAQPVGDWSIKHIGLMLFTRYEFMFELISLVLLVAILGAIITAAVLVPAGRGKGTGKEEGGAA